MQQGLQSHTFNMSGTAVQQQQPSTAQLQEAVTWKIILDHLAQGQQTLDLDGVEVGLSEIVCSLLQCSKGMTAIVHAACAGRVDCRMDVFEFGGYKQQTAEQQQQQQQQQLPDLADNLSPTQGTSERTISTVHVSVSAAARKPKHEAVGRWLAKHARLMRLFSMQAPGQMDPRIIEQSLTAGLSAAVGRTGSSACDSVAARLAALEVTPASAVVTDAVPQLDLQPAAATAAKETVLLVQAVQSLYSPGSTVLPVQAVQSLYSPGSTGPVLPGSTGSDYKGSLLVQEVNYEPVTDGAILSCFAGSQHLTKLHISIGKLKDAPQFQRVLASLTALRELDIEAYTRKAHDPKAHNDLSDLAPAFQGLTKLDSLHWCGFQPLTQHSLELFPVTLPQLKYAERGGFKLDFERVPTENASAAGGILNFGHMTALTKLEMGTIIQGDVLPPALLELDMRFCDTLEPVSTLQHLRKFVMREIPTAEQCIQLQAVTSLTEIDIGPGGFRTPRHTNCGRELAKLPIVSARFYGPIPADVVSNVAAWTALRELELRDVTLDATLQQLAQQLESLVGLACLVLSHVQARNAPWVPDGESVTQAFLDSRLPGATALVRASSRLPKLELLSIDRVWLGPAVFDLKPGPKLKSVYLRGIGWHVELYKEVIKELQAQLEKAGVEDFRFG